MNLETLIPRKSSFLPLSLMKNFYKSISEKDYPSRENGSFDNPLEFGNHDHNLITSELMEYVRDIPTGGLLLFHPVFALAYYTLMTYFQDRIPEWIS